MYCSKCGRNVEDTVKFCPDCGEKIFLEKTVSNQNTQNENVKTIEEPPVKTRKSEGKQKNPKFVFLLLFILMIVGGILFAIWYFSPEQTMARALQEADYETAYAIYMESDVDSEAIVAAVETELTEIEEAFHNKEIDYATATQKLTDMKKMEIKQLTASFTETQTYLDNLNASATAFQTGNSLFDKQQYAAAIEQYQKVIEEDTNYAAAVEQINITKEKYREQVLNQAAEYEAALDYAQALLVLQDALKLIPNDSAITESINVITVERQEKLESDVLALAKGYADEENYLSALNTIQDGIKELGSNTVFTNAAEEYESSYITQTEDAVNALLQEKKYQEALDTLYAAQNALGRNARITELITDVQNRQPVNIATLEVFDVWNNWEWNEGDSEDVFGNEYGSAANYAHLTTYGFSASKWTEYRLYGEYETISGVVAPSEEAGSSSEVYFKIYSDDLLIYTSPKIYNKTDPFYFEVSIQGTDYLRLEISSEINGGVILSDVFLNKE